jgi:hypothetical protein
LREACSRTCPAIETVADFTVIGVVEVGVAA